MYYLYIHRVTQSNPYGASGSKTHRLILIRGSIDGVDMAKRYITGVISSGPGFLNGMSFGKFIFCLPFCTYMIYAHIYIYVHIFNYINPFPPLHLNNFPVMCLPFHRV